MWHLCTISVALLSLSINQTLKSFGYVIANDLQSHIFSNRMCFKPQKNGDKSSCWLKRRIKAKLISKLVFFVLFRSTSKSRPNNIRGGGMSVRTSVRPSTKSFFDFNEIWYTGRGRWVMHDGMPYGRIQGQGQGHEPLKVWIPSIFNTYLLRHLQWELASDH